MKKHVEIVVCSKAGEGKTTIAYQIANFLHCAGFNVDVIDEDKFGKVEITVQQIIQQFAAMVADNNVSITVRTQQVNEEVKSAS